MMEDERVGDLPPGFSFDPTDEELVLYYLKSKIAANLPFINIPHLDFSSSHPWELNHERALWSKKQWYFFSQVKENVNRATGKGYWKEISMMNQPIIHTNSGQKIIGIKKYFVYYITTNIHDHQLQTNWIMEEFHLSTNNRQNEQLLEWVICRVHESKKDSEGISCDDEDEAELSALDEVFLSLDDEEEISFPY
ncbi:hypothetical protein HAX54_030783 [Datura stramonium]|uniref:NAC domain-containing protein n=1 Tax=Datura stramonium TaxID=4076 RepID=A0ABS8SBE6_DATST|nr:hypothetical protein [Datura stramonium]